MKKMTLEEMYKKGLITEGRLEELKKIKKNTSVKAEEITKGDRITVTLHNNESNDLFKRQYRIKEDHLNIIVTKINKGINHYDYTDRNGNERYTYYTEEYAKKHNISGEPVFSLEGVYNDKKIEVSFTRIETIKKGLNIKLDKTIQKAFDYCNLNSQDDDIIDKAINKYKSLRDLSEEQKEQVYNIISSGLGYQ